MAAHGVRARDRVALVLPSGLEFVTCFWAIQLLGATACAVNPYMPEPAIRRRVSSVAPTLSVTATTELPAADARLTDPAVGEGDPAILQLTSGTEGEPQAAVITHRNTLAQIRSMASAGYVREGDVLVDWIPPWHDMGLHLFVVGAVYLGTPCFVVEPAIRNIPEWLATVGRVGGTFTAAPDFAYRLASRMVPAGSVDLSSLRTAASGGEPVRRSTIEAFEERLGAPGRVLPGYGLAEATLGVTTATHGEELVVDGRGNVSCGWPFPGLEVSAGSALERPGEILVRGETVFAGYLDAPDGQRPLRDGWLHTGDEGYLDADGRLYVLGRQRAMLKRAGAVIAPRELEDAAYEVDGVRYAAAVSHPPRGGQASEIVTVVLEVEDGASSQAVEPAVTAAVESAVGFAPHRVVVAERRGIPRTDNGKTRYDRLRALLESNELPATTRSA